MIVETITLLRAVGNPNKAKIVAHLVKHKGETADDLSGHLGYPLPTVYKYLRELEAARIIESKVKANTRIYYATDFRLIVSPQKLMEAFEEQSVIDAYKARFGDEGIRRFNEAVKKVKAGKMTYRQATSTLGISYYEFVSLLEETQLR